ncbi:MAG: Nif3-like dinuclear metal center hexameric protein [Porcipelethomonas sp.]
MISIDKRLELCAQMISGSGTVCDIGTDHAYLPVYLIQNQLCSKAVASDINEGPLQFARQTVGRYGCEDDIAVVKSDGLENIDLSGVSDIVIAGMGGETIAEILHKDERSKSGINFVFQPMTRAGYLRKWLYKNGYEIIREEAVIIDRFVYTVMSAVYTGIRIDIGLTAEITGKINPETEAGRRYCENQLMKMLNISTGLSKAGKADDSKYYSDIAVRLDTMMKGKMNMVSEIYKYIDSVAPFATQEKWDNSGLLTGNMNRKVSRVLICLDITGEVAEEAIDIGAELIISHHPVIFHPLYSLLDDEPACRLWKNGISAICVHTPFDCAENGMSDILMNIAGFEKTDGILEILGGGDKPYGFGSVGISDVEYTPQQLAQKLRDVLGCRVVKFTDGGSTIKKAAFCTGSGGNLIEAAANCGADAYITSEVKHDQWHFARRKGISLFDCGHYHTEIIGMQRLRKMLEAEFANIEFVMSQADKDPVSYAI